MTVTSLNEVFAAKRKRANPHHLLVCIASAQHADTIAPPRTLHTNPLRWPLPRWAQWFYNVHAKIWHRPQHPLHPVYMTGASALLPFVGIASASFRTCSSSEAVSLPSTSMNGLEMVAIWIKPICCLELFSLPVCNPAQTFSFPKVHFQCEIRAPSDNFYRQ